MQDFNLLSFLLGIVLGLGLFIVLLYLLKDRISSLLQNKLNEIFPKALHDASEQLVQLNKSENQEIKTDLSNKKDTIEKLVTRVLNELEKTNTKAEGVEKERIGSFRALQQELENQRKISENLAATTDNLKKVLSNNQLRGQFGEQVAEDLLKMAGFVRDTDYLINKRQTESSTRPDFTILLPDGVKINVDAKFPYANLQKMTETDDQVTKKEYVKKFEQDIKEKIKQVTTRDYIDPANNTVDFVILFVPNEMIFSFIYEKMNSVWTAGMREKVIFAGPFNFTAILRLIKQSYNNFKYQNNVRKIITLIKEFEGEFGKYNEEFQKIGDRINSLSEQYQKVDSTRTKQLVRTVDKIRIEDSSSVIGEHEIPPLTEIGEIPSELS
jgi:DNA recombination protein RmuC